MAPLHSLLRRVWRAQVEDAGRSLLVTRRLTIRSGFQDVGDVTVGCAAERSCDDCGDAAVADVTHPASVSSSCCDGIEKRCVSATRSPSRVVVGIGLRRRLVIVSVSHGDDSIPDQRERRSAFHRLDPSRLATVVARAARPRLPNDPSNAAVAEDLFACRAAARVQQALGHPVTIDR